MVNVIKLVVANGAAISGSFKRSHIEKELHITIPLIFILEIKITFLSTTAASIMPGVSESK